MTPHEDDAVIRRPRRTLRPKAKIELPDLPAHWHAYPCDCEPCVIYLRVSAAGGRDRIISPMIQFASILEECHRNNRRIVGIYFDLKTGKTLDGRKIHTVVKEITDGKYRTVAVHKWDRWGRNTLESLQMCDMVDKAGGQVVSSTEAFNTKTPAGNFIRTVLLGVAELQSKLIGENWKGTQQHRKTSGLPHSGRDRIGYAYINRRYVIDKVEAETVRQTYEQYVSGVGFKSLARQWNTADIVTTTGAKWTPQALCRTLDTGFAAGYIRERSDPGNDPANTIAAYDIWRQGDHQPIISEGLWQQYRARREAQAGLPSRLRTGTHALSGLIFCGTCGRRANTKYMGRNGAHHWVCNFSQTYHPGKANSMTNAIAEAEVRRWVEERAGAGDAEKVTKKARELADAQRQPGPVDGIMTKLGGIAGEKFRARDMYQQGDCTRQEMKQRVAKLDVEEQELRVELARAKAAEQSANGHTDFIPMFTKLAKEWENFAAEERSIILKKIIGMVQFFPQSTVGRDPSVRIRVVPVWEMSEWGDAWLSARRRWQELR